ncbi:MAG: nucleoside deaminase [Bacteroidota bacterium]|nr:nucleoside deaminase [Bacteroidota bacterium]
MMDIFSDEYFMKEAFKEAQKAQEKDEIPVGAIIVCKDRIVARSHNLTETLNDVTAHAEMQAITAAENSLGGKYLHDCTMYVTLEPCTMCAGALYWSQISKLVFAASDKKRGYSLNDNILHPKTEVISGVMKDECGKIISDFFKSKR